MDVAVQTALNFGCDLFWREAKFDFRVDLLEPFDQFNMLHLAP